MKRFDTQKRLFFVLFLFGLSGLPGLSCSQTSATKEKTSEGMDASAQKKETSSPDKDVFTPENLLKDEKPNDPRWGKGWWHDGRYIRDNDGRTIILRGWNMSQTYKKSPTFGHAKKSDYLRIGKWGFNVLRFVMNWALLEAEKGKFNQNYLDGILERLDWAKEAGLYVVLDMHQDIYGVGFKGNGAPAWSCPEKNYKTFKPKKPWYLGYITPEVQSCFDNLYKSPSIRQAYVTAWTTIVEATHKHPAVVGFDLMNEPFWGTSDPGTFHSKVLQPFYEENIKAIRKITQKHLIFIEPIAFIALGEFYGRFKPFADKKLVYAAHFYLPSIHDYGTYSGKVEELTKPLKRLWEEAKALKMPLWFGEYGSPGYAKDFVPYMNDVEKILDQWSAGSAYWSYENGGFAPPDKDGKVITDKFNGIHRPFPRAVAGAIISIKLDLKQKKFTLKYKEDGARNRKTEIFLPAHIFGDNPKVTSSDPTGKWSHSWNNERHILTIKADPETTEHTITTTP